MMRSRPRFAANDIGGPQLPFTPRVLVQQPRVLCDQRANSVQIVAVDSLGHAARMDKPRPAGDTATSRQHMLRVAQLCVGRFDVARMKGAEVGQCIRVAAMDGDEQISRLMLQLFEVGQDREMANGHDEPP